MEFSNKNARKIYEDFGEEKVILDIKNTNLKVKFIKSYISILIYALIGIALGINIIRIKNGIFAYIAIFFIMVFFIRGVLSQICKMYFCKTGIILENKLNKRKIIDIEKYPRIYIKYKKYLNYDRDLRRERKTENYILCIEQNENKIELDIKEVGSDKIRRILNNFEMKKREDVTDSQWQESANNKEKTFLKYQKILSEQEKIIGVKDTTQKIIIINNSGKEKRNFIICTVLVVTSFILDYIARNVINVSVNSIFNNFFSTLGVFFCIFDVYFLTKLVENGKDSRLRICYPSDSTIMINKYFLNYKENVISIGIRFYQDKDSDEKYNYKLEISGENNSYYIGLKAEDTEQLVAFFDNLIFEPKKAIKG